MALKQISSNKCFGGLQKVFEHDSSELKCKMKFAIYLPPKAENRKCPALYWLSGLTCTEQNFIPKSGYHQAASEHGLVVIAPDRSPHGCNIKGEDESWDFRTRAGFYVNDVYFWPLHGRPWSSDLYFKESWKIQICLSICSNLQSSALLLGLFKKAFSGYLGPDQSKCKAYDATHLVKSDSGSQLDILIDQGKKEQFLSDGQLLPDDFIAACTEKKTPIVFRLQEGYDHSYYFIATFITDHIRHHAKYLNA
uniref:S-formylglutathione hydrolase n=1 Tax=Rhinolophus ferrumequinum TaxID=59479 RepID=A0A671E5Y1_RHIFE